MPVHITTLSRRTSAALRPFLLASRGPLLVSLMLAVIALAPLPVAPSFAEAAKSKPRALPLTTKVKPIKQGGSQGLRVSATSSPGARCSLSFRAGKTVQNAPARNTDKKGRIRWQWFVPDTAPSGTWRFDTRCIKGKRVGAKSVRLLVITRNKNGKTGDLVAPSTMEVGGAGGSNCWLDGSSNKYCAQQCTWYVKNQYNEVPNYWGDAHQWNDKAAAAGWKTGNTPKVGAIAVWEPWRNVPSGHVAIVKEVYANGVFRVREHNWAVDYGYGEHNESVGSAGSGHPSSFIYPAGRVVDTQPLTARNDGQLFGETTLQAGGSAQAAGFNLKFNEAYTPDLVLRPDPQTAENIATFIQPPGSKRADWPGQAAVQADPRARDTTVGYFRLPVAAPAGTPPGDYLLRWNVVDKRDGRTAALQPSFVIHVPGPRVYPKPPANSPPFQTQFAGQDYPKIIAPAEEGTVTVKMQNWGSSGWSSAVRLATPDDTPIAFASAGTINNNRVPFTDEDGDGFVQPGEIATFTYKVRAPSNQGRAFRQRFGLVRDGPGPRFGYELGVYIPTVMADSTHFPVDLSAADCTWAFVTQGGSPISNNRLDVTSTSSSSWYFTIKNTSDLCPWFNSGPTATRLATDRARDRVSAFADMGSGWVSTNRVALPNSVLPGETVQINMGLRSANALPNGNYDEYFTPVIDGLFFLADIGTYIPIRKR